MKLIIAHRGNLHGKSSDENSPKLIEEALSSGFHAEIDVWKIENDYYLGHDAPQYPVKESFLQNPGLWCHAKNASALFAMKQNPWIHCFWHNNDDYTFTSKGFIWAYPGKPIDCPNTIACMPEMAAPIWDLTKAYGVCTDRPFDYLDVL